MSAVPNSSMNFLGLVQKPASPVYSISAGTNSEPSGQSTSKENSAAESPKNGVESLANQQKSSTRKKMTRKLHRIGEVRVSQGVSERTMCRRLNLDVKQLRIIEDPTYDLSLSNLAEIRDALEVPFADLLVENDTLSRPVQERAQMLKIMKTVVSIRDCKLPPRAARLAQMLSEQLIALMPELAEVGGWPEFGSRRSSDSVARVLASEIDTSNIRSE